MLNEGFLSVSQKKFCFTPRILSFVLWYIWSYVFFLWEQSRMFWSSDFSKGSRAVWEEWTWINTCSLFEYWSQGVTIVRNQKPRQVLATEQWLKAEMGESHWNRTPGTRLCRSHLKILAQLLEAGPKHVSWFSFLLLHSSLTDSLHPLHLLANSSLWFSIQCDLPATSHLFSAQNKAQQRRKRKSLPSRSSHSSGSKKTINKIIKTQGIRWSYKNASSQILPSKNGNFICVNLSLKWWWIIFLKWNRAGEQVAGQVGVWGQRRRQLIIG